MVDGSREFNAQWASHANRIPRDCRIARPDPGRSFSFSSGVEGDHQGPADVQDLGRDGQIRHPAAGCEERIGGM